jgi:hypothetical protein
MRFWRQITRGRCRPIRQSPRRAPLAPKPGHLTQSPCLNRVGVDGLDTKTADSPHHKRASSYQNRCISCACCPGFFGPQAASIAHKVWWLGQVTGLWGGMLASWDFAFRSVASRVLSPQNRMHLTQSPRRASIRLVLRPGCTPHDIQWQRRKTRRWPAPTHTSC